MVEIRAVPHDLYELLKRAPSLWPPRLVRRQVARVEVRNATRATRERTKISSSREIVRRVHCLRSAERWRKQIRVPRRRKFDSRIEAVTPVAIHLRINDITAQSNQRAILSLQIQGHGSNRQALFDLGFIIVALIPLVVVILCAYLGGSDKHRSQT